MRERERERKARVAERKAAAEAEAAARAGAEVAAAAAAAAEQAGLCASPRSLLWLCFFSSQHRTASQGKDMEGSQL